MVQARLLWFLEVHSILPSNMTGFRCKLATKDNLLELCSAADDAKKKSGLAFLAAFVDVRSAFDIVSPDVVSAQLQKIKVTGRTLRFITDILNGRATQVRLGSHLGQLKHCPTGLPQGTVLSPQLFNVVVSGLPEAIPSLSHAVQLTMYADNFTIWTVGSRLVQLNRNLQRTLNPIKEYLDSVGLSI
ncbi:uncharacterized protein LOC135373842 [Ornithodoros turicata]|uniref:uncharacterized protein LOC135373842 n=1 Tax=Ornithodoros turicata TaxID=34597 RepID=UPI003139378F